MAAPQELKGHRDLKVFQLACKLAMEIFHESKSFPKEERFSLTDQIRRSSRSVAANSPTQMVRLLRPRSGWISREIAATWLPAGVMN
jgi:hypothetical protein